MTIAGRDVDLARRGLPEVALLAICALPFVLIWVGDQLTPKN